MPSARCQTGRSPRCTRARVSTVFCLSRISKGLYGLARDIERLRGELRVVGAVRVAQKHPEPETLDHLAEAVAMLGELPALPIQKSSEDLEPEDLEWDEDDEVTLDPRQVPRPLQSFDSLHTSWQKQQR